MGLAGVDSTDRFSLVVGGPFHAVLYRLKLVGSDLLPTTGSAIGLALIAWLLPALLVVAQSLLDDDYAGWDYFTDWMAYTRYLIAICIMIATERYADRRFALLTRHFREARLLSKNVQPAFSAALNTADRHSSSTVAEVIILVIALVWPGITASYAVELAVSSWEGAIVRGEAGLSWAGEMARFISTPLFLFLALRWIWRFLVWSGLLFRISRMPLQLTPLHPDRSAGLGFLAIYPSIFSGFVFALSCVIAASFQMELSQVQYDPQTIGFALAGWLVLVMLLFLGPLLAFVAPLHSVREQALLDYGSLVSQHHLAFHRRWIREARNGEELIGSPDPSTTADLNASILAVKELRVLPVDRVALMQLALAAGLPVLLVVMTQLPFFDLVKWILSAIL